MNLKKLAVAAALAIGVLGSAHAVPVALELALVIDISGSVDASEYTRQRDGYKVAFQDAGVGSAIASFAGSGGVAVGVYYFADGIIQTASWTQLLTATDAFNYGTTIGAIARPVSTTDTSISPITGAVIPLNTGPNVGTATNIAGGLNAAVWALNNNAFEGARRVIDISGDGKQNVLLDGSNVGCTGGEDSAACNLIIDTAKAAVPNDIVVNGLAIEGAYGANGLTTWYNAHVKKNGGFVVTAANFDAFESAVVTKIGREISGVPEPTSLALVGLALVGLGASVRRRA